MNSIGSWIAGVYQNPRHDFFVPPPPPWKPLPCSRAAPRKGQRAENDSSEGKTRGMEVRGHSHLYRK